MDISDKKENKEKKKINKKEINKIKIKDLKNNKSYYQVIKLQVSNNYLSIWELQCKKISEYMVIDLSTFLYKI